VGAIFIIGQFLKGEDKNIGDIQKIFTSLHPEKDFYAHRCKTYHVE